MKTLLAQPIASVMLVLMCASGLLPAPRLVAAQVMYAPTKPPAQVGELWKRTELFFGTGKPDGAAVTEDEINQFVDDEITPRFPDGLTVLTGYGQFRNSAGALIQEQSVVLILLYPPAMREASQRIEEIRTAYKTTFQQESVLRVDSYARVSF